ncbi:MAG: hypothetical protein PUI73_10945 [bacterium]|nr:hypothetical protein [bacterium]
MKYNKGMPLYAVFPLLYREDVLSEAWKRVKANKGSSGVDGIEIEDIETMGIEILRKWKKCQKVDLEGQQQP